MFCKTSLCPAQGPRIYEDGTADEGRSSASSAGAGMPCMRAMVKPMEWAKIQEKLSRFAEKARCDAAGVNSWLSLC